MEKYSKTSVPMYGQFLKDADLTAEELTSEKMIDDAMAIVHSEYKLNEKLDSLSKNERSKYYRAIGHCILEYKNCNDSKFLASKILESLRELDN